MGRRLTAIMAADMAGYSRLMEQDEDGVLARQKIHRKELIDPQIAERSGRIVKTTGDGLLVEFASVQEAVRCAINIQTAMARREEEVPLDGRILYRVGINLCDVISEDGDVFGDGVNVASRLEGLAEPGGVCISDVVHQLAGDRAGGPFRDMGSQRVKNISRPIRVWQWTPRAASEPVKPADAPLQKRVHYATASDGVQIAWASMGTGSPVLKAPNWMNHIEYQWRSAMEGPFYARFARACRFVHFDQRGNGLSDWDVDDLSEDAIAADMHEVVRAAGLERFAVFGLSQGCPFAIRYAHAYPEQVTCLVLLGGFLRGRLKRPGADQQKFYEVGKMMIRDGWGSNNPIFRRFFTSAFVPEAPPAIAASFDELQRLATSPAAALRLWDISSRIDVTATARMLNVPTLVLHCEGDRIAPLEEGRLIARTIPGATFIELPGSNHIILEGTPAFDRFFEEATAFLSLHNN
jgi:class 3 adenylate cyclase/pimeloyl-ACP methyl ester carboxylesterase